VHPNTLHLKRVGSRDQTKKGRKKERESTVDVVRQWAGTAAVLIVGGCLPDDTAQHLRRLEYWVRNVLGKHEL
jgi:methionine synthase I (cobalamin-dependent)